MKTVNDTRCFNNLSRNYSIDTYHKMEMNEFTALNRWKNLIYIQSFLVDYQWHIIMICDSCISDKPRHSRKSNLIKGLVVLQIKLSCIKTSNNIISFWSDVTILLHNKRYFQSIFGFLDHFSLIKMSHHTKIHDSAIKGKKKISNYPFCTKIEIPVLYVRFGYRTERFWTVDKKSNPRKK